MRAVLPLGNGGLAHLFALTEQQLTSMLAEAKMCCYGETVMLVGDLNADPSVIPSPANWRMVHRLTKKRRFPLVEESHPHSLANLNWMKVQALVKILLWHVPLHLRPPLDVVYCWIVGSHLTLPSAQNSLSRLGMPLWPCLWKLGSAHAQRVIHTNDVDVSSKVVSMSPESISDSEL